MIADKSTTEVLIELRSLVRSREFLIAVTDKERRLESGRAQMRLWTKQLDEGLHAAVSTLSFCVAFRHQWLARSAEDRAKWLANIP
jgi:glutathione S-transferase